MKYSNWVGLVAILLTCWACTQKWVFVNSPEFYLTGFKSTVQNNPFGSPGKLHLIFGAIAGLLFIIPKVWAKRTNFVFTALNLAWGIRNFFAIGLTCRAGTCPTIQPGLYVIFICSIIIFIMSLLPKLDVKPTKE
jgi:hypothetical protein